ncbi:tyrosinase family oxidase copper chaperone [Streptomyces fragilis]|uniref:Tyrosinase family oxidase copper chaperone n=1 Tax=Streptomyces fragilis TaxID=67301 RepID=A0ABV2YGW1_9ACTN|nr:tyrosinase family oxidase copper chaperone [Streptomyces fragilis]
MSVLRSRRGALRFLLATAFAAVTAPVVAAAASRPQAVPSPAPSPAGDGPHAHRYRPGALGAPGAAAEAVFDEVYRGRRIRGFRGRTRGTSSGAAADWHVTLDDQPLHLMRRADGSYLSMVDHYGSYPTPREAARAAVDQLSPGERLSGLSHGSDGGTGVPAAGGAAGEGRGHDVHA